MLKYYIQGFGEFQYIGICESSFLCSLFDPLLTLQNTPKRKLGSLYHRRNLNVSSWLLESSSLLMKNGLFLFHLCLSVWLISKNNSIKYWDLWDLFFFFFLAYVYTYLFNSRYHPHVTPEETRLERLTSIASFGVEPPGS